jgi:hypothetical protein
MNKKPIYITFMSIFFLTLALMFPIQISYLYEISLFNIPEIVSKLTFLNLISIIVLITASIMTFKMNKRLFYYLPIINFFIFFNNYIVAEYGQIYSHTTTLIASLGFLITTLGFYQRDIHKVYHDFKFRYWLTSPRFKKRTQVKIQYGEETYWGYTHDISASGMFIVEEQRGSIYNIPQNVEMKVTLIVEKTSTKTSNIKIDARIVRKCMARGNYPQGVGVNFSKNLSEEDMQMTIEVEKGLAA